MISKVTQRYIVSLKRFTKSEQNKLEMMYNLDPRPSEEISSFYVEIFEKLTAEEKEVLTLMRMLYILDELTEEEHIEARMIFSKQNIGSLMIQKKLELMIPIKQQIAGKKTRKFNVGKSYARAISNARRKAKDTIIYAQLLDNNTVQLSGYVKAILKPSYRALNANSQYYENIVDSYMGYDEENKGTMTYGNWRISGNFKILEWEHGSDKNWRFDSSFSAIQD